VDGHADPRLRAAVEASLKGLETQDPGDPVAVADLELMCGLEDELHQPSRRAEAVRRLFLAWDAEPRHVLWPELAAREHQFLGAGDRRAEISARAVGDDTLSAMGAYVSGWLTNLPAVYQRRFLAAYERREELTPFQAHWITLKAAFRERRHGRPDLSLRMALDLLPTARPVGGRGLEALCWKEAALSGLASGELDDALVAVDVADTLAAIAAGPEGPLVWRLRIRDIRARILAARGDEDGAFAQYDRNIADALARNVYLDATRSLIQAASLAETAGQRERGLRYGRQALDISIADGDSLNVPRVLMNIARRHRMNGELDSCLAYQRRAEVWIRAYPDPSNQARMPLLQAEYYAQVGQYAVMDSLLEAAARRAGVDSATESRAELHLELIRGWMESGRPDLIYRSLAQVDELRNGFRDTYVDRHVTADLNLLIGEFLTQRGEYARAAEALDLAAAALARRPDPKREWTLARNRGVLARERGLPDLAETQFRACVALGDSNRTPDQAAAGRFLLGSALLDQGRYAEARAVLPDPGAENLRFTTRVSSLVLQGRSWSLEGRLEPALAAFAEARTACRSWTPPELTARIELEEGRALARAGRTAEASRRFVAATAMLERRKDEERSEDAAAFTGDLRRDLVEAVMQQPGADPVLSLRTARRLLPDWNDGSSDPQARAAGPQVVYFVGEERSGRWLAAADGGVTWRGLPGRVELRDLLAPVLADLTTPGRTPAAAPTAKLAAVLLDGVADIWPSGSELMLVPDLDLFGLAWAALPLPDGEGMLIDRGALAVHDHPAAAGRLPDLRRAVGPALVLGADNAPFAAGNGLGTLRHAEQEARDVAALWPASDVRLHLGAAAAGALREPGPYAAVHVASHALVYDGRSDRTMLVLPEDAASAMTGRAIRGLNLETGLVFLSCCEAADGRDRVAGFAGLARSFLDAGARSVVAPLVVVDDAAARALASRFYSRWLTGASVPEALRLAQQDLRADPR